jgi:Ca2+-binding RTX toxin-like protein
VVLAVAAVLALVATSGTALAANIHGNGGDNRLVGTDGKDTISGGSGYDDIFIPVAEADFVAPEL